MYHVPGTIHEVASWDVAALKSRRWYKLIQGVRTSHLKSEISENLDVSKAGHMIAVNAHCLRGRK